MLTNFYLYDDDPSPLPQGAVPNPATSRPSIEKAIRSAYCRDTNTINATLLKHHELSITKLIHDITVQPYLIKEGVYQYTADISHLELIRNIELLSIYPQQTLF